MDFSKKTVLITGAAGNLGAAVAELLSARGAHLVLLDLRREGLEQRYGQTADRHMLLPVNLLESADVQAAVLAAQERFGRIDVLCNLAGGFRMGPPVHATQDGDWDFLMDVNVRTLLNMVRAVVPGMLAAGGGSIVNVGAQSALRGAAHMGAYCASKGAVIRLTESMAAELREQNIRVNCVLPSIIDTPENRAAMPEADPARWVSPQDLAQAIAFLASDAARAVHGVALPVSGLS
ncbi:SDR family NAD(P)-dependent oxidoreductase [Polaromonas sp. JS666]|uniref:SDR family oxidoreductase n=1 Tax=Polaromonas sp. (strain JS666 / ATCC BAA-500) TaxID=296591 RepID=UPI00088405BF|nr:SDR family NAD(P)-dependent oxidoreductase [Polaromonas sp. JS666]SDM70186.1 NADP-dependent 3-hydroxy acid dehydrogenase YdfG [Polaromonas sp. JS666]